MPAVPSNGDVAAIRIALIDATPLIRTGLRAILDGDDALRVVADGAHPAQVTRDAQARGAQVFIIDPWGGAGAGGLDGVRDLAAAFPRARIIIMSHATHADRVAACMDNLAHGYVDKSLAPADVPALIRQVASGLRVMPTPPPPDAHALTPREHEVLQAAASGKPNGEIARELFVTEQTVKFHLSNVYRKLGARNRTEAAHAARRRGLLG